MKHLINTLIVVTLSVSAVSCGKNGKNGAPGLNGIQGEQGQAGEKGDKGEKGEDGQDATPMTIIKFCPGLQDDNGRKYTERGLCVDGKAYAVYSGGNMAALTELPDGLYRTTTPSGHNCSFELVGCDVTQL